MAGRATSSLGEIVSDVRCVAEKGDKVHKTQGNRMAAIVIPSLYPSPNYIQSTLGTHSSTPYLKRQL
jgi:hypothetical protein